MTTETNSYLVELEPWDPVAGATTFVGFGKNLFEESVADAPMAYPVRLKDVLTHESSIFESNLPGETNTSLGTFVVNNSDGRFDYLLEYSWDQRRVYVKKAFPQSVYASYQIVFKGYIIDITANDSDLVFTLSSDNLKLAKPLQPLKFAGTGGKEGGLDLKGRRKPLLYSSVRNATPILLDTVKLTFQVHSGPVTSIDTIWDNGNPIYSSGNYATYALLEAANIPPGTFGTCHAEGYFRLGAPPVGVPLFDATGKIYSSNLATQAKEIIKEIGSLTDADLDLTAFSQTATDFPYIYEGLYFEEPEFQIDEFLETVVASMNGYWYMTKLGKVTVGVFKFSAPVETIREEDIKSLTRTNSPLPINRLNVRYARNLSVQNISDFVVPRQTFNGSLSKSHQFIATAANGTGGVYTTNSVFNVYLNDTKINDFGTVQFKVLSNSSWLNIDALGNISITDPGVTSATGTLRANFGEFFVDLPFTVTRSLGTLKSMVLTANQTHIKRNDSGVVTSGNLDVTAALTGTTVSAVQVIDNLGNTFTPTLTSGTTYRFNPSNLSSSVLVQYVTFIFSDSAGIKQTLRVPVLTGEDGYAAGILSSYEVADGQLDIYYQNEAPTGAKVDDLWYDTNDNNRIYRYTGTLWEQISDTRIADALTQAANAQITADTRIRTYLQEATPTGTLALGDLWYKPSTRTLKRWDGSAWSASVGTVGAQAGVDLLDESGGVLTDNAVVTADGIAAGIEGQGGLAVQDTVNWLTDVDSRPVLDTRTWDMAYESVADYGAEWLGGSGNVTLVTTNDTGGGAIQVGDNSGNDSLNAAVPVGGWLPYDHQALYEIIFDVEFFTSDPGAIFYGGVAAEDRNGVNLGSSYNYVCFNNVNQNPLAGQRIVRKAYLKGVGPGLATSGNPAGTPVAPVALPDGSSAGASPTVRIRPVFYANFPSKAGKVVIHGIQIKKLAGALSAENTVDWLSYVTGLGRPSNFADVTIDNIASGVFGQTEWATYGAPTSRLNNLSDSGIFNSLANITSRNLSLLNGRAWTNLYRANGTTPITDASAITLEGISAGFSGQTSWATYTAPTSRLNNLSDSGVFNSLANVTSRNLSLLNGRAWTNLYRANGTTPITDASAITLEGISAGFSGQTAAATAPDGAVFNYRNDPAIGALVEFPEGGFGRWNSGSVTGGLRIDLPQLWTNTMISFEVDLHNYAIGSTGKYIISGYLYTGTGTGGYWFGRDAKYVGDERYSRPVTFGSNGSGKACIWIGAATDTWSYPSVRVRNVQARHSSTNADLWKDGWGTALDTGVQGNPDGLTSVFSTIAKPYANQAVFGETVLETSAGVVATRTNFRTDEGISAGFSGQGLLSTLSTIDLALYAEPIAKTGSSWKFTSGTPGHLANKTYYKTNANGWNAPAMTKMSLGAGARVSATIAYTSARLMVCLTKTSTPSSYISGVASFYVNAGTVTIYRGSTVVQALGNTVAAGDRIEVLYTGQQYHFILNGLVIYTMPVVGSEVPHYGLVDIHNQFDRVVDLDFFSDAPLSEVKLTEVQGDQNVIHGGTIYKRANAGWNSLVATPLVGGHFKTRAVVASISNAWMIGFGAGISTNSTSYVRHELAIYNQNGSQYKVYQNGASIYAPPSTPAVGDLLEIEYLGTIGRCWINGVQFGPDFNLVSAGPMRGEVSLNQASTSPDFTGFNVTPSANDISIIESADRSQNLTSIGRASPSFLSSGDARPFAKLIDSGQSANGSVVSFGSTLATIPKIGFGMGGKAPTAGKEVQVRAENLSASGFTMKAVEVALTPGTLRTDSTDTLGTGGEPDRVMHKNTNSEPWDGKYTYTIVVTVPGLGGGEPGTLTVNFFARQGGVWVQRGTRSYSASGTYSVEITPGAIPITTEEEYGVSAGASGSAGAVITDFVNVKYTEGTITETTLTTNTSIPWLAHLEN